ncbi:acyl-CoA thioesterase [Alicyclobacillus vulcanalis]|uniref:Acyl-CoA thioesterase n=1 Tax=Alicyclobacillus vulcanalis TaxID=252246 RepID=A0A1N7JJR0_9BACL|nr:thioesterase family protein [Alicyclobacillus vulcanalis]SIS49565.1 Acyl-CoA thioesterase [Alicyclobacillus vulcanalis]
MSFSEVHPFDDATRLVFDGERFHGEVKPEYYNMVGPFGGITAATMLRAAELHPRRLGEPLALTVNFAAPARVAPFEIDAVPVRTNRSTQHFTLSMIQDGEIVTTATAVFGVRRESWSHTEAQMPVVPPPGAVPRFQAPTPLPWMQWYHVRLIRGSAFDDVEDATTYQWMRDEPLRPLDHAALAALCDTFVPRVYVKLKRPVPIGTVTFSVYFLADPNTIARLGTNELLGVARATRFHQGYFDQIGEVWSQDGVLLATTTQLVYMKAPVSGSS